MDNSKQIENLFNDSNFLKNIKRMFITKCMEFNNIKKFIINYDNSTKTFLFKLSRYDNNNEYEYEYKYIIKRRNREKKHSIINLNNNIKTVEMDNAKNEYYNDNKSNMEIYIRLVFIFRKQYKEDFSKDIWKITYDKSQNIFKCENDNETVIYMNNVENFVNIWVSNTSENIKHNVESDASLNLILGEKNNYLYKITSNIGIHSQVINKIIGILKDIKEKDDNI